MKSKTEKSSSAPTTKEREEARSEADTWNRILNFHQGEESGWMQAANAIRTEAGQLYADGKDAKAKEWRDISEWLMMHAQLGVFRKEQTEAYDKQIKLETIADGDGTGEPDSR
jgi:hypothetical protein